MRSIIFCLQLVAHIQVSHGGGRWISRRSAAVGNGRPRCTGKSQDFAIKFSQRFRCFVTRVCAGALGPRKKSPATQAYKPQDRLGSLTLIKLRLYYYLRRPGGRFVFNRDCTALIGRYRSAWRYCRNQSHAAPPRLTIPS